MCFNPVKSWQLGWYEGHHKELDPDTEAPFGAYVVGVDVQNPASDKVVVIKIPDNDKDYYVGECMKRRTTLCAKCNDTELSLTLLQLLRCPWRYHPRLQRKDREKCRHCRGR